MSLRYLKKYFFSLLAIGLFLIPASATAATTAIVGGTNGPACDSGGYFTPSSVTVTSGNTVTISVPADDPYAGGVEVHGFPEGNFVVARGGSHTTSALSANVSYYGTWPSTSCMKGSGSITVAAAPAPAPVPTPSPTNTTTTPKAITPSKPAPTVAATTPATTSGGASDTTASPDKSDTSKPATPTTKLSTAASPTQSGGFSTVASISAGAIVLLAIGGFVAWRWLLGRRVIIPLAVAVNQTSPVPTPPVSPVVTPTQPTPITPTTDPNDPNRNGN